MITDAHGTLLAISLTGGNGRTRTDRETASEIGQQPSAIRKIKQRLAVLVVRLFHLTTAVSSLVLAPRDTLASVPFDVRGVRHPHRSTTGIHPSSGS
ncbi:hypothetical protein [Streptomyces sp. NPDC057582]|uniref:hypothetical protein n=1 Tax=unclassified Streptomyces TaxID=2593676 RepID=UPI0036CF5491